MRIRGVLKGHTNWVTSIAVSETDNDLVISSSRDKSIIRWDLSTRDEATNECGRAKKSLTGHSHFVQDVTISRDSQFALSASWDRSMRLWDLNHATTHRRFTGHTGDVLSVAFSANNRQIVSGSRDRSIKLWNTVGECKLTIDDAHNDWVSSVSFSPNPLNPIVVSAGWDKLVKIWSLTKQFKLDCNLVGHTGYVNAVTISPDGSLCASGGKDSTVLLWDLNEGKRLRSVDVGNTINTLSFCPTRFWLVAGTDSAIKIIDLETKEVIETLDQDVEDFNVVENYAKPSVQTLAWSKDGSKLFAGYNDGLIRVWIPSTSRN